jgi:hypothetical protein
MITIKHKNGVIAENDLDLIPKEFISRISNGVEWFYFETIEEFDSYMLEKYPNLNEI